MSEQILLMVFVGLVALALVVLAAIGVAVGWQLFKLVGELREVIASLRHKGERIKKYFNL